MPAHRRVVVFRNCNQTPNRNPLALLTRVAHS
jgi:hypothetical protein